MQDGNTDQESSLMHDMVSKYMSELTEINADEQRQERATGEAKKISTQR